MAYPKCVEVQINEKQQENFPYKNESFSQIFWRVMTAKNGYWDTELLSGSFLAAYFRILVIVFSFFMVFVGAFYMNDCTIAEFIPLCWLLMGFYGLFEQILYPIILLVHKAAYGGLRDDQVAIITCLLRCKAVILCGWATLKIYELCEPNYNASVGLYCNKSFYLMSVSLFFFLWLFVIFLTLISLLVVGIKLGQRDSKK